MQEDIWIRLPDEGSRCEHTGLSRTSVRTLLEERDPSTGEFFVESVYKKQSGATRGVRLIRLSSLKAYLERLADHQRGLRWAEHVSNPDGYRFDEVLESFELFSLFIGPENAVTLDEWFHGSLSTRRLRILALLAAGVLKIDSGGGGERSV